MITVELKTVKVFKCEDGAEFDSLPCVFNHEMTREFAKLLKERQFYSVNEEDVEDAARLIAENFLSFAAVYRETLRDLLQVFRNETSEEDYRQLRNILSAGFNI